MICTVAVKLVKLPVIVRGEVVRLVTSSAAGAVMPDTVTVVPLAEMGQPVDVVVVVAVVVEEVEEVEEVEAVVDEVVPVVVVWAWWVIWAAPTAARNPATARTRSPAKVLRGSDLSGFVRKKKCIGHLSSFRVRVESRRLCFAAAV